MENCGAGNLHNGCVHREQSNELKGEEKVDIYSLLLVTNPFLSHLFVIFFLANLLTVHLQMLHRGQSTEKVAVLALATGMLTASSVFKMLYGGKVPAATHSAPT